MHLTTRLLRSSSPSSTTAMAAIAAPPPKTKLLLPPATYSENIWNAIQGVWHVATDSSQRQAFEDAIANHVIKDTVLQNAYNGATLTFCLFWNLQNPLWKKNKTTAAAFDAKEFSVSVGPALTNFHDFLHSFQNQIRQEYEETPADDAADKADEEKDGDAQKKNQEDEVLVLSGMPIDKHLLKQLLPSTASLQHERWIRFMQQSHSWREQAADDPDSVAACLGRMTTEEYMDGFIQSTKLGLGLAPKAVYEEGSSTVGQVAILNARAMEIPLPGQIKDENNETKDYRYEEFKATEEKDLKMGVAAQIDVLYELSTRFHEQVTVYDNDDDEDKINASSSSSSTEGTNSSSGDKTAAAATDPKPQYKTEHVEYTSLGVAVFEGWLDKEGDNNGNADSQDGGLRWRVPLLREPSEFPMSISAMRTVLETTDGEIKAADDKTTESTDKSATTPTTTTSSASSSSEETKVKEEEKSSSSS